VNFAVHWASAALNCSFRSGKITCCIMLRSCSSAGLNVGSILLTYSTAVYRPLDASCSLTEQNAIVFNLAVTSWRHSRLEVLHATLLNSIHGKGEKYRAKKRTKRPCLKGWICEDHPNQPWGIEVAELRGSFAKIHGATKTRILFFYPFNVRYRLAEESPQSEKLHSTLKIPTIQRLVERV
jgi:hypothetical protein